jgi:hypothetical protein
MKESPPAHRTVPRAAADFATYLALRRTVAVQSLALAALGMAILVWRTPMLAIALGVGCAFGIANMFLTMRSGERLVESRSVAVFVLSSFLRIGLFGIVAAAFALRGSLWSMGAYFAGLFLPLVLYAVQAPRAFGRTTVGS